MKFSVVIPVLNGMQYIRECLDSLPSPTDEIEYIFVDNGSTDGTMEYLVKKTASRSDFRLLRCKERGISYALNLGIGHSQHDVIVRMDCDDVCAPHRFYHLLRYYKSKGNRRLIIGSDVIGINRDGKMISYLAFPRTSVGSKLRLARGTPVAHPTVAFSKELFDLVGGYPAETSPAEDYSFWLLAKEKGASFKSIPKPLLYYRIYEESASSRLSDKKNQVVCKWRREHLMTQSEVQILDKFVSLMDTSVNDGVGRMISKKYEGLGKVSSLAALTELLQTLSAHYTAGNIAIMETLAIVMRLRLKSMLKVILIGGSYLFDKARNRLLFVLYSKKIKSLNEFI